MPRLDFKKERPELYRAKHGRIDEVRVPRLRYLALDGMGDPSTAFAAAMGGLFSLAYPLKFAIKARDPRLDYAVMPPEGLYPGTRRMYEGPRERWRWTLLVLQPVKPTATELRDAKAGALEKGAPADAQRVELRTLAEGRALQTLHLGPYEKERETIARLEAHMREHRLVRAGAHHEIYLSDPGRVAPSKVKTLLRQPVRPRAAATRRRPRSASAGVPRQVPSSSLARRVA